MAGSTSRRAPGATGVAWRFGPLCSHAAVHPHHGSKVRFRLTGALLLVLACMIWGGPRAHAQGTQTPTGPAMGPGVPGSPVAFRAGANIRVTILDENKKPLKQQSLVRVTSQTTGAVFFHTTRSEERR